jgi:hypothetical protein
MSGDGDKSCVYKALVIPDKSVKVLRQQIPARVNCLPGQAR